MRRPTGGIGINYAVRYIGKEKFVMGKSEELFTRECKKISGVADRYFPLYVDISEKDILMVGAGRIALRRLETLLKFESRITIVAKELHPKIRVLVQDYACVRTCQKEYEAQDLEGRDLVLACTDSGEINREIVRECRKKGILVNASDCKELCDFYFPSVIVKEELVVGIGAGGENHRAVKETRKYLEKMLNMQ